MLMMMMMPMYFTWGKENIYLFESFTSTTSAQYWLWLALIFFVNFGIQALSFLRTHLQNKTIKEELIKEMALESNL